MGGAGSSIDHGASWTLRKGAEHAVENVMRLLGPDQAAATKVDEHDRSGFGVDPEWSATFSGLVGNR